MEEEVKTPKTVTHGMFRIPKGYSVNDPAFNCWKTMISRCLLPSMESYQSYGAKGITVCERWRSFAAFLEDMGPRPSKKHTLDRYPNGEGNYEPGNVRWATVEEQFANRCNTIWIEFDGQKRTICDWAKIKGLPWHRIWVRMERGWSAEEALSTPVRHWGQEIEHDGVKLSVREWSERTGIAPQTIRKRMRSGWDAARILTPPCASVGREKSK